jgi:hypothetical protein
MTCGSREFELLGLRLKGAFQKQKAAKLSGVTAFGTACVYIVGLWERTELRANQGGHRTPSIFQISPVRVTTYAVFPMNSSEVGWFRPSVMTLKVPSP